MGSQFTEAVEDLKAACQDVVNTDSRGGVDALRRFVAVIDRQEFKSLLSIALPPTDFATWLDAFANSGRSNVGSGILTWPADVNARVALQLEFFRALAEEKVVKLRGVLMHIYGGKMDYAYASLVSGAFQPFSRDLGTVLTRAYNKALDESAAQAELTAAASAAPVLQSSQADPRCVFVVHGRNELARVAMFAFLRAIGLQPLEWTQSLGLVPSASPYVGAVLEAAFRKAQAVVVLLSGDDEARLREPLRSEEEDTHETTLTPQARANVLFEAGLAFGIHPERTVLVELGRMRPFSDIAGRHTVRIGDATARRQDLANRLLKAGCAVILDGTDWHSAGEFDAAIISKR